MSEHILCILGCGNLGTSILTSLLKTPEHMKEAYFSRIIACVRSASSEQRLTTLCSEYKESGTLQIYRNENVKAAQSASIIILGVDPADVGTTLKEPGLVGALKGKLLISVVAGWTRPRLENVICRSRSITDEIWIVRALPNVAAQISQSITAIEDPDPSIPKQHLSTATAIFEQIGRVVHVQERLMPAATAVGGSTPAFWAIICDAFIDAAVAVGMPRDIAQQMIYQSMRGSAEMLQNGIQPGELRDMGTSPEGCTIGGVMVMEEAGVRGALGKALREAVTIARLMGGDADGLHVNDTR